MNKKGFTLLEVVVVMLIGVILVFLVLFTFDAVNRASLNQDRLVYMNSSLRTASAAVTSSVASAGFGLSASPDYAIRAYDNVTNVVPGTAGFDPANNSPILLSGGPFTTKALADSDALLTIRADGDCEHLTFSVAGSTWADPNYTLVACLPQPRCALTTQDTFGTPWTPSHALPQFDDRVLLVVDEGAPMQTPNRAMHITATTASIETTGGTCPGNELRMSAVARGLQISNAALSAGPTSPIGHLVTSSFFYLGEDLRLYQFPLTYFGGGVTEVQGDRAIAESVDSFQLQYYDYVDTAFAVPREGCLDGVSCPAGFVGIKEAPADADGIPNAEYMRMVDVALLARSEKPDNFEFVNQGSRLQLFDDPTVPTPDNYRRRLVRQQVLARNLDAFNLTDGTLYP